MKSLPESRARLSRRSAWRLAGVVYAPKAEESLFERYLAFLRKEGLDAESMRTAQDIDDGEAPAEPKRRAHWTVLVAAGILLWAIVSMIGRTTTIKRVEVLPAPAPAFLVAQARPPVFEV